MTEREQLAAMVLEYSAHGLSVETDVPVNRTDLGIKGVSRLDLVAWPTPERTGRPALIVEVANRTRHLQQKKPPWRAEVSTDERARLNRFDHIARALRGASENPLAPASATNFVIRFFDVTAEQGRAREVTAVNVRSAEAVSQELKRTKAALEIARDWDLRDLRALAIAREWSRWLRLLGRRFPARRRALPQADLRTIQKELYDRLILPQLPPARYQQMHGALLAVFEGGDVDWGSLLELEVHLKTLLEWAAKAMLVDVVTRGPDTFDRAQARARERDGGSSEQS